MGRNNGISIQYGQRAHEAQLARRLKRADKQGEKSLVYDGDVYMNVTGEWVPWWAYRGGLNGREKASSTATREAQEGSG